MFGNSMEIDSTSENSIWLFDYGLMEDISAIPDGDLPAAPPVTTCFSWPSQEINNCSNVSVDIDSSFGDSEAVEETGLRKRLKSESCNALGTKACREKSRRDRLNERFVELGSVLEPGRPPNTDKAAILGDAVRMVRQLRSKAQKLRESNEDLQEKIKELKAEKNELRIEKQTMKEEKEKLEHQVKALTSHPGFLPHPFAMPVAYGAHGQTPDHKLMPFITFPSIAMWQLIPPAVRDTSHDHVLHPPVA
ncbi:transcription factor ILR3-like [Rhododendron vialii]|uniref:transcription factor ILR3-like n=1 Tax=Rhododendron vialii TaxID=182163 RepID=UPI00265F4315|nr:transcription factor ILR3-like [Rhododendron vialii]